jgi:hypothetical protein
MSLQPVILVGVGGSGSKALRTLRQTLLRRLRSAGWTEGHLPSAWQMVALDTITVADADGYPEPMLPGAQYLGMVPPATSYGSIVKSLVQSVPADMRQAAFGGWLEENIPTQVAYGAGQNRAVGRAVAAFALDRAKKRIDEAFHACTKPDTLAELARVQSLLTDDDESPKSEVMAFVITSVAGGTGSGMFVDVIEALTAVDPEMGMRAQTILFGPDVFGPILNGAAGAGIAANTLAAVASVTAGVWNEQPSEGTTAMYQAKGLVVSKAGSGLIPNSAGSRYNFVLGAVNAKGMPVGTMEDAYRAAGDSLAAAVADPEVMTGFRNFFRINTFENSYLANQVGDKSELVPVNVPRYTQPFGSFGSAKVSLGAQRFAEYASQGIARSLMEKLLWPALEPPDPNDTRTDAAKIRDEADLLWPTVLVQSGLDERGDRDDVVDALLSPEVEQLAQAIAASLTSKAATGAAGSGLAPAVWARNIQVHLDTEYQRFVDETSALRAPIARSWIESRRHGLMELVSSIAARSGIAVAAELASRLRDETRTVATTELPVEAGSARRTIDELPGRLSTLLTGTGLSTIPSNHPIMGQVQGLLAKVAIFQEAAVRYDLAAELLLDIEESFLAPLGDALKNGRSELATRVSASTLDDGRPNPFDSYPRLGDQAGRAFTPNPTELLLVSPSDYPEILEERTRASLEPEHQDDWRLKLLNASVDGVGLSGEALLTPFFKTEQQWSTRVREAQSAGALLPAPAKFSMVVRPDEYVDRAATVIEDPETALGRYVQQSLKDFLNVPDPALQHERRSDFVVKLAQAFTIGAPLAQENHILMRELHPQLAASEGGFRPVVSAIPIDEGDELYDKVKNSLSDVWDDQTSPKWFKNTKASEINIFQASKSATSAMAITSLMEPVSQTWQRVSRDPDARQGFWRMKRARPLVETIPVAPEYMEYMIEGWFIAGILGQREEDSPNKDLGFRTRVWDEDSKDWLEFPYPLLGTDGGGMNQLPGVLNSLLLAMAACNHVSSLTPLRPYQRLRDLGEQFRREAYPDPLTSWINTGTVQPGTPAPSEKRAGSASSDMESRRDIILATLEKSMATFERHFQKIEETKDPFAVDLVWELRDPIRAAHRDMIRHVGEMVDEDGIL